MLVGEEEQAVLEHRSTAVFACFSAVFYFVSLLHCDTIETGAAALGNVALMVTCGCLARGVPVTRAGHAVQYLGAWMGMGCLFVLGTLSRKRCVPQTWVAVAGDALLVAYVAFSCIGLYTHVSKLRRSCQRRVHPGLGLGVSNDAESTDADSDREPADDAAA